MNITYDTATKQLTIDASNAPPHGDTLTARLNRHGQTIDLRGLSFGVTVTADGETVTDHTWPPKGVCYSRTNQDTLASIQTRWAPDQSVTISAWFERGDMRVTASETFTAPRPPQPFPSWTWVGGRWIAPTPMPDDGAAYNWDEDAQAWVEIDDTDPAGDA